MLGCVGIPEVDGDWGEGLRKVALGKDVGSCAMLGRAESEMLEMLGIL